MELVHPPSTATKHVALHREVTVAHHFPAMRLGLEDTVLHLPQDELHPQEDMADDHREIKIRTGRVQGLDQGHQGRDRARTTRLDPEAVVRREEQEEGEGKVRHRCPHREEAQDDAGARVTAATAATVGGVEVGAGATMEGEGDGYVVRFELLFTPLDFSKKTQFDF